LAGGVGCGKTEVGIIKSIKKSFDEPNSMGVIASNTYRQLTDSTLTRFLARLDEWKIPHKMNWNRMVLRIAKNPPILCRTLTNWEKLAGIEIGWFYIDEAWGSPVDGFRELSRRLRCPKAKRLEGFLTTNLNGFDWIYDEFYDRPMSDPMVRKQRGLIRATTLDNPLLAEDYLENLRATLTYELLQQWVFAMFVRVNAKACYYNFNRTINVNDKKAEFVRGLPVRLTMDFNYNPLCASVGQQNGGVAWTFDEFVLSKASTWDLCDAFIARFGGYKGDVHVYGDATGARHQTQSTQSDYQIIKQKLGSVFGERLHFRVPRANPPVRDRLNAVNSLMKNANGEARYFVHSRCRKLILDYETAESDEINAFAIDKRDSAGSALTHPSDAAGYWITKEFPIVRPTYSAMNNANQLANISQSQGIKRYV
jgi:hypothetical protein